MDAAAEIRWNPVSKHQIQPKCGEMSRMTRDGTAELVSRYQILRRKLNGDREIFIFPVQLTTNRIGNLTRLIHTLLYVMTIHTIVECAVMYLFFVKIQIIHKFAENVQLKRGSFFLYHSIFSGQRNCCLYRHRVKIIRRSRCVQIFLY